MHDCNSCAARSVASHATESRRDFLRDLTSAAAAAAAAVGLSSTIPWQTLAALPAPSDSALGTADSRSKAVRYPVPAADGISIDKNNEVILCRSGAEVMAFALSCPHQNTALRSLPKNGGFQCPRHKSKYTMNGTFVSGKATRNMDRLQITLEGAVVVVDPAVLFHSDTDPAKWAAALVRV
ncbi:MAG: Rieske 2Fe-2S domain-containing protein [Gemmatimonadaceae bacterium]|nr:Rieske 2Fe-2S domain-containing protein [Gemmatimonadaceae bacterium]